MAETSVHVWPVPTIPVRVPGVFCCIPPLHASFSPVGVQTLKIFYNYDEKKYSWRETSALFSNLSWLHLGVLTGAAVSVRFVLVPAKCGWHPRRNSQVLELVGTAISMQIPPSQSTCIAVVGPLRHLKGHFRWSNVILHFIKSYIRWNLSIASDLPVVE